MTKERKIGRLLADTKEHDKRLTLTKYKVLWRRTIHELEEGKEDYLAISTLYTLGRFRKSELRKVYEDVVGYITLAGTTILSWGNIDSGYYFEDRVRTHYAKRDIKKIRDILTEG